MTQLTYKFISKFTVDIIFMVAMILYTPIGIVSTPNIPELNIFDPKINHQIHKDQISDVNCLVIALILPLIVLLVHFLWKRNNVKYSFISLFGLIYSVILTSFIIIILKNLIGKPRPDFVSRCKPNWTKVEQLINQQDPKNIGKIIFFNLEICEGLKDEIFEGLRSHPSGHSALSFSGLNYLSLWLLSNSSNEISKHVLCFIPNLLALFVAITRIQDYKHDYYDITIGAFVGISISYIIFKKMFKGNEIKYLQDEDVLPIHNNP